MRLITPSVAKNLLIIMAVMMYSETYAATFRINPDRHDLVEVIANANAGDTLLLEPGEYRANLIIEKPLTLQGQTGAIIDGNNHGDVIRIRSSDVTIRNLRLRNSGANLTDMNAVVFIEDTAYRTTIEDNRIESSAFGIWLQNTEEAMISNNEIQGDPSIRSQDRGNGIHLFNTRKTKVIGNRVRDTRDGIYIDTSNHNVLRDNHLYHLRYGIHYMYSYHNEVIGNRTNDTRTGYALMQSKYLTVTGNRTQNDKNYGILMNYILYSTIANNTVSDISHGSSVGQTNKAIPGGEGKALFVYNSQQNKIHNNTFANSGIGIHLTAGSKENQIHSNNFLKNRTQVKYVSTNTQEWSKDGHGNYWTDYLGWDLDADGIGDKPYQPIDGVDHILWKYPSAKILLNSPAIQTLRWVQEQFPVLRPQGVKDSYPRMNPASVSEDLQ
ncbi:MAG: nitrous oxide reductase family maturation protein NosD [Thiohalophilus sp.]|uniref:nitrous oxide reductase family maturation protein NosD n=1 Tax=Thiohalophilus sp. TaxID=3028392 RepID=UPI00286FBBBD|nr:nitrous oxide reductase family maturation protein NosD [Thiohalophilus sp.]MDR9436995.1 nitrous oxide reductase family maturation protein NosD [Thiohalophilus sp.]